jgi:hypothetical protein
MKRRTGGDEQRESGSASSPGSSPRGTGKALKEVLRSHRPDPALADEVRELRGFFGPAQARWRE